MKLPAPVQAYFDADNAAGADAPTGVFAPDAVLEDEGQTHASHAAIEAWWHTSKERYQHTTEPCDIREERGLTVILAKVSGRFPGSPVHLTYAFQLDGGRIAALEIGA